MQIECQENGKHIINERFRNSLGQTYIYISFISFIIYITENVKGIDLI